MTKEELKVKVANAQADVRGRKLKA